MAPSLETDSMDESPARDAPGFYLLDDANGRFVVDPDFGFISLRDEALLLTERGAVHVARLRVVEPSGEEYTLDMRLRITGRVPQMLGPEEGLLPAEHATVSIALTAAAWEGFAGWRGNTTERLADENSVFGALIAPTAHSHALESAVLSLAEAPPPPANRTAHWAI